jgi:N-acyl-D-aspartate/D-glutamate deacylase
MTTHELVIRGGTVVDGTGAPARTADVAVDDGRITEVGKVDGKGTREVHADGLTVAPGWVDIHTHYDGQVTWDPEVSPSSWHGVTTVVMGNCGVGFAPARRDGHDFLIELMEGVEDIPGSALHEGIDWQWESFPEYLDALDAQERVLDIAAQVPHAALRAYVLGDRAHEAAEADEIAEMARLTTEAMRAGAAGFTTSRTFLHRSKHGLVPGTSAPPDELLALGDAVGEAGHGVFQLIADGAPMGEAGEWMTEIARRTGRTVTYSLSQSPPDSLGYRKALDDAEAKAAEGLHIVPQVPVRPTGMLFGLQSSLHPFITHPTYRAIADLPSPTESPASATPRSAPSCSARSRRPARPSPASSSPGSTASSRSAIPPTTSPRPRPRSPPSPSARAAAPRRSSSTGCSNGTGSPSSTRRSRPTRTRTSTPAGR